MKAHYQFAEKQVNELPLTMSFTATLVEWRAVGEALRALEERGGDTALKPLQHCVKNLVQAIEDATGHSYRTRGYTYAAEQDAPKQLQPSS